MNCTESTLLEPVLQALMDRATVTTTLCQHSRVKRGWGYRRRMLNEQLCYLITAGSLHYRLDQGDTQSLGSGGLLWLPPGQVVDLALGSEHLSLFHARFSIGSPDQGPSHPVILPETDGLEACFQHWQRSHHHRPPAADARIHAAVQLLTTTVMEYAALNHDGHRPLAPGMCQELERWVAEHRHLQPTPADLAQRSGLSSVSFTRRFKARYGEAPRTWLLHDRLRAAAAQLLESTHSIDQIAEDLGYRQTALFCRQFKTLHGVTPSAYRRRAA